MLRIPCAMRPLQSLSQPSLRACDSYCWRFGSCRSATTGLAKVGVITQKLRAMYPGPGLPPVLRAAHLDPGLDVTSVAAAASPVEVVDMTTGQHLGWGLWNPHTHQFRVRVLEAGGGPSMGSRARGSVPDVQAAIQTRVDAAVELRCAVLGLPSPETDVFRLINREGDHLSGLAVDVLGKDLVVRSSALWVEVHRELVEASLRAAWPSAERLLWQREADSLMQDGFQAHFGHAPTTEAAEESPPVVVREAGVRYVVSPGVGKKTGHFADQRENRVRLRDMVATMAMARKPEAPPLRVLDLFCYSAGFGVNAALAATGARGSRLQSVEVTAVDMAASAVEEAERTVAENGVGDSVKVVNANAFVFLQDEVAGGNLYDVVVCDPPRASYSGGWSDEELKKSIGYHRRITRHCLRVMRKGSILVTFTCSQVLTETRMLSLAVMQAAATEGRSLRLIHRTGCGGDHALHPAWRPSGHLEGLWFMVE